MRLTAVVFLVLFTAAPALAQSDKAQLEQCIEKIDHDPEGAYQAMKEHITFVLDFVRQRRSKG